MAAVPLYSPTGSYTAAGAIGPRPGYISLYEENVDRAGSSGLVSTTGPGQGLGPFEDAVKNKADPQDSYTGLNPRIVPFVVKNGDRLGFTTVSKATFAATNVGAIMANDYPLTASISKEFYDGYGVAAAPRFRLATVNDGTATGAGYTATDEGSVSHLFALRTAMDSYINLSPYYAYSSSVLPAPNLAGVDGYRTLGSREVCLEHDEGEPIGSNCGGKYRQDSGPTTVPVGLLSIPSIFYGSSIRKGSVNLRTYISGTLVGELRDLRRNGELIQVGPTGSVGTGSVAGVVLYNEGFIVLTGSWSLDATGLVVDPGDGVQEYYGGTDSGSTDNPRWIYFAQGILSGSSKSDRVLDGSYIYPGISTRSSSYYLRFQGTTKTPVLTMMAHAKKNALNHSNNPTYVEYNKPHLFSTGSMSYIENDEFPIKNTVSSSYNTPTGSFKKTTYITKIGIYDEQKNLIGIASLANPVKKTEDRNFTFKLKLDI
jgi:hypothetical protein